MSIREQDETIFKGSERDVSRNQKKVEDAARKRIHEIIAQEDIITRRKGQKARVTVKGIQSYRYIFDRGGQGVGHGEGKDQPGDKPGEVVFDTDWDLDRLIDIALEECGLPNLKEKKMIDVEIPEGYKLEGLDRFGLRSLVEKRRVVREAIKRQTGSIRHLAKLTGFTDEECRRIFIKAKGNLYKALELIAKELTKITKRSYKECYDSLLKNRDDIKEALEELKQKPLVVEDIERKVFIHDEDLRFRVIKEDIKHVSNAVILPIRDASSSMDDMKKFLSKMLFFWLKKALERIYQRVEIRFILHTTEAERVNERDFFFRSESGGTLGASGYRLASSLVDTEYNPTDWNIYPFHFSDGEDFSPDETVKAACELLKKSNMLGYGEIVPYDSSWSRLMNAFEKQLETTRRDLDDGIQLVEKEIDGSLFVGMRFSKKEHLYPVLKEFLRKDREVLP